MSHGLTGVLCANQTVSSANPLPIKEVLHSRQLWKSGVDQAGKLQPGPMQNAQTTLRKHEDRGASPGLRAMRNYCELRRRVRRRSSTPYVTHGNLHFCTSDARTISASPVCGESPELGTQQVPIAATSGDREMSRIRRTSTRTSDKAIPHRESGDASPCRRARDAPGRSH